MRAQQCPHTHLGHNSIYGPDKAGKIEVTARNFPPNSFSWGYFVALTRRFRQAGGHFFRGPNEKLVDVALESECGSTTGGAGKIVPFDRTSRELYAYVKAFSRFWRTNKSLFQLAGTRPSTE
jgi:hypothetical protein